MKRHWPSLTIFVLLLSACASAPPEQASIADLKTKSLPPPPPAAPAINAQMVLKTYRAFLKEAPDSLSYREALRRSADVELETAEHLKSPAISATNQSTLQTAIAIYLGYLDKFPGDDNAEKVLYQLAKAYDLSGQMEKSLATIERLLQQYPDGHYSEEALFRSGEMYFSMREHAAAQHSFELIIQKYPHSLYFERALYMSGWSLYLQSRFADALQVFFTLLDHKLGDNSLSGAALSEQVSKADRELLHDSLKVICLSLSYQGIKNPIATNFARHGDRAYEALIYRRLGEFYLDKQRYLDAAQTFMGLTRDHPDHPLAPAFHQYAIKAYQQGGFRDLFFAAKAAFIENYGIDSRYWKSHDEDIHRTIRPYLAGDIKDLAAHFHSLARRSMKSGDFDAAVLWYREYLKTFSSGREAAEMNFMLAECLHDSKRYQAAIAEYEKSAYQYDTHKSSAEAGYAALLTYKEIVADNDREQWRLKAIASAIRFSEHFPQDRRVDEILANTADELYAMHDYARTIDVAQRLLARPDQGAADLRRKVWVVLGHARFDTGNYIDAQQAYQTALALLPERDTQRAGIIENLAAALYKQGEQRRSAGDLNGAVALFMQIEQVAPAPSIWIAAKYDAAAGLIQLGEWAKAASVLEDFRRRKLGDAQLQHGVTEKLALVYMKTGQKRKAAHELEALSSSPGDRAKRRELIWEAAALYQESGADYDAVRLYKRYISTFPTAFAEGIEARHNLSVLYTRLGKSEQARLWLNEIIKADANAGAARSDRSRQLAGEATLSVARPLLAAYQNARLTLPLKKSLKAKKSLMEKVIVIYKKALEYHVAEVSTAATFHLANIYDQFSKAISSSERPHGLSKDELEQYNILLEDQSYSFQDKAIQLHEANIKHIADGIYDEWIKDSLKALAVLYPVRYAKTEQSETFFDAIR